MRDRVAHSHLRAALVGPHTELYQTSADFRASVEFVARALPAWIDALAAAAQEEEVARTAMTATLETGPAHTGPLPPTPESAYVDGAERIYINYEDES